MTDVFAVNKMMSEVDGIIADHLKELSPEDRENSYSLLHGICKEIDETPSLIAQSLELMDQEISNIQRKDAYILAETMNPDYVKNPDFRLKFLRGDRFSVMTAAAKIVNHFEMKKFLFGASKLVKDIEQDDMSEEDIVTLYSGYVQWSPLKDTVGRTISIVFPLMSSKLTPFISRLRVSFYLRMIAMEDVNFQRKSVIAIVSAKECGSSFDPSDISGWRNGAKAAGRLSDALPGTYRGVHICFPSNNSIRSYMFSSLVYFAVSVLSPLLKVLVRVHRGEIMEDCMAKLQSFGINPDVIPKSPDNPEYQTNLLQSRRNLERLRRKKFHQEIASAASVPNLSSSEDFGEWVCGPSENDVILGRGQRSNLHPGNIRLRRLVEDAKGIYDKSTKRGKTDIAARIVVAIQLQGRFLQESGLGWVEVNDKAARQKVSHAFRDTCKKKKKKRPSATKLEAGTPEMEGTTQIALASTGNL